jgi:hypothetical protein
MRYLNSRRVIKKSPEGVAGQGKRPVTAREGKNQELILGYGPRKPQDGTAGQGIWEGQQYLTSSEHTKSQDGAAGQGKLRKGTPARISGQGKNHQTAKLVRGITERKPTRIERGVPVGTKGLDRGVELSEFCAGSELVRAMQGTVRT